MGFHAFGQVGHDSKGVYYVCSGGGDGESYSCS